MPKTATVTVNIKSASGAYTISVTGKDTSGANAIIGSEISGKVHSVDMSETPPVLHRHVELCAGQDQQGHEPGL